jgi:hypothetical protein
MPIYGRHFEPGQLQFITTSTYRRVRVFSILGFPDLFLDALRETRSKFSLLLVGWVLMPEILLLGRSLDTRNGPARVNVLTLPGADRNLRSATAARGSADRACRSAALLLFRFAGLDGADLKRKVCAIQPAAMALALDSPS